jgi:LAO/AO transport system kinase
MTDRRELARLLTRIESEDPEALARARSLPEGDSVRRIGITGPPGAGKSTLLNALIGEFRRREESVAVLAVDPSSPITGGALLGDRIRMQDQVDDLGVYVRSMSSRGHLGGLAESSAVVIETLCRSGFDNVLVETVGVGQSEVEVMHLVDVVVLVVAPGWGDHIQADKAGVLEIADVVVVNKGDRPGADDVKRALLASIGDGTSVLITTAITGEGVAELAEELSVRS